MSVLTLDLSKDMDDLNNCLNDDERHFISHLLAFFTASDGFVENLWRISTQRPTPFSSTPISKTPFYLFDAVV